MKGILILSIVIISTMGNPTPQPETPPTTPPMAMPTGPVAHPQTAPIEAPANHTVPGAPHNGSVPAPAEIPAPAPIEPTPVSSATVLVLHSETTTCVLKAEYHNDNGVQNVLVLSGPLGANVISPPYSFPMFTGLTAKVFLLCDQKNRKNEQVVQAGKYLLWGDRALMLAAHTDQKFWAAWSSSDADELVLTSNDDKPHVVSHNGAVLLDATDYKQIEWKKNGNPVYKHDITQNFAQKTEWIFTYVKDGDKDNSTMTQVPWMAHTTSTVTVLHGVTADAPATATFNILHLDGTTTESAVTVTYGEAKKLSFVQGDIFVGLTIKVNDTMIHDDRWMNLINMEALLPNGDDYLVGDNVTVALLGKSVDDPNLKAQFIRQNSDEALASAKMSVYRFANTLADGAQVTVNIVSDSMPNPAQPDTFPAPIPQPVEPPKPAPMEQPKPAPMEPKPAPMEPKAPVAPVEPKTPVPMPESPKPMTAPVEAPKPAAPVAPTTSLFSKFFAQEIKPTQIVLQNQGDTARYMFDAATFTSVKANYDIGAQKIEKDLLADAKATPQGEAQIVFFVGDSSKTEGPYVPKAVQVSEAPQPAPAPAPVESGESGFWSQPWPYIVIAAFVLVVFGGGFYFYKKQKEQTGSEGKPLLV